MHFCVSFLQSHILYNAHPNSKLPLNLLCRLLWSIQYKLIRFYENPWTRLLSCRCISSFVLKNTPCSYFNFFFIPRSIFLNAKEVSCRAENHKSFFVGFVCRVDFIMFRKHPNRKFPVDFEQEKDARFETRERCNRICLELQIYIHVQCISERQAFPILLTFISLNQLFSDFQIVDGF